MKSDTQLRADIQAELEWDPAVASAGVGVVVLFEYLFLNWRPSQRAV